MIFENAKEQNSNPMFSTLEYLVLDFIIKILSFMNYMKYAYPT